jgi:hypothetical protein
MSTDNADPVSAPRACLLTQQAARPGTIATPASPPMLITRFGAQSRKSVNRDWEAALYRRI